MRLKAEVIIMDLSKAFGSLHRDLLWGKLEAYGLENNAVSFVRSCLTNSLQRCKRLGENICWGPTRIYIRSATFQYFHQLHLLISSKM